MIFLSHTHADKPIVEPIAKKLSSTFGQENVFYDSWSIQPGDGIIAKMNHALESCKFFFFFVSKNSLLSKMVELEWQNAIVKATKAEVKFVPVKMDDSPMPGILLQSTYIDFYNYGPDVAIRQIIDVINSKNIFREGEFQEFQNIRGYISPIERGCRIEIRAEVYMEPQSHYAIGLANNEDDITIEQEGIVYPVRFIKNWPYNGNSMNVLVVQRGNATSPNFPFVLRLFSKTNSPIEIIGVFRAISTNQIRPIPLIQQ